MKLTEAACRELQPGQVLKDHVVKGLHLRARAGVKAWHLYYRHAGLQRRPKLGDWPGLKIEAARDAAREWLRKIAGGHDPSAERIEAKEAPTVTDLAAHYFKAHVQRKLKPRSAIEATRNVERHILPRLGRLRVRDVTRDHVQKALDAIDGPIARNRVRAAAHTMFALACDPGGLAWRGAGDNPVRGTTKAVERPRRRYAAPDELAAIRSAIDDEARLYPAHVTALMIILLSGSRVTELLSARWTDLAGSTITLREHKTDRTGDFREIRLSAQALALLGQLPRKSELIFGGIDRYHVNDCWARICKRAGVKGLQVRDLRRTFASRAKSTGISLDQIGELFGHRNTATTAGYAWLYSDAAQAATQRVADDIEGLMLARPKAEPWSG